MLTMSTISRKSGMFGSILVMLIFVSGSRSAWSAPADEPIEMLARAVALYYEADFAKSIELLLRADELLLKQSGYMKEKTDVKLQLALGFIGLNDNVRAKTYLRELYVLDADYRIDRQLFSPKVIQLAEEAKNEESELRCRSLLSEAQRQLGAGNSDAVVGLIGSNQSKCAGLVALNPKAAELFFKEGQEIYRKGQMEPALKKFRTAMRLDPKHELAAQYVDLTESKLEVAADRAFLAWRKDFNAGEYASAARGYRELSSLSSSVTIEEVRMEYRRVLSGLVESWNSACANDDVATMEEIRLRVNELLPDPSFAEDILAKMTMCTHAGCIQMSTQLALARLKSRVDPQFSSYELLQLRGSPLTVRIIARIDENGDASASELEGGNPLLYRAVRTAFDQWKFSPAVVQGEARCVETEIPIVINFTQN